MCFRHMRTMAKYTLLGLSAYGVFILIDLLFIFKQIDKTLEPSYYFECLQQGEDKAPPPVYLVSYAGRKSVFFKNQNAQALSAINQGIDHIMMYKRSHFDEKFQKKNQKILDVPMGDGLWIWKPYIMLQAMDKAPENAIIIYADSPVIFKNPITPFIKRLQEYDVLLLLDGTHRKGGVPKAGEKIGRQFVEHFRLNHEDFMKKDHLWACFVAVRNNKTGRAFVEQWMQNCENGLTSTPLFDQSMLIIASHQQPKGVYVMDTDEAMRIIKNVHRHPQEEDKSLLPDIASKSIRWFKVSKFGYNAKWVQWVRAIIRKHEKT